MQVVYLTRSTEVTYARLEVFIPRTKETMVYIYTRVFLVGFYFLALNTLVLSIFS